MMEIKLCGITRMEDAALAAELEVDALGFIFYPHSPRYISPSAAKGIIEGLTGKRPVIVGVFVNEEITIVKQTAESCGLDMIQLHGDESVSYCRQFLASSIIKALIPKMEADLDGLQNYPAGAILIDARDAERYGGTGKLSDWETARKISRRQPIILAGGLNEVNVRQAIEFVLPGAVDINSGIESAPGRKDAAKMKGIVEIIRTMRLPQDKKAVKIFKRG
ncbi:MAG: phosphoribosylanthranilate isomerase [Deltaproteobacteria bacterium]|nr:phosphoribosylanthranilate isomerase [Deltaproteobacteria bacterium]